MHSLGAKNLIIDTIPNGVTSIGEGAFSYCMSMQKMTIPGSVLSIGSYAFQSSEHLTSIIFENGVQSLENSVFSYCKRLSSVTIPDSMKKLGALAFSACDSLKSITIPSSVTTFGGLIFLETPITVRGEENSAIQAYAINNSYPFISVDLRRDAAITDSIVVVNGKEIACQAYNIQGYNYFKLRDIAMTLNGTGKTFEVGYDDASNAISLLSGQKYTPVGRELTINIGSGQKLASLSTSSVYLNGSEVNLQAYNIDGYNYFKLRDIAKVIDFGVEWNGTTNTISINTGASY